MDTNTKEVKEYPLCIILKKHMNIHLKNKTNIIGRLIDGKLITEYDCIYQEFEKDYLWIMFKHIPAGEYLLEVIEQYEEDHNIFIIGSMIEEELTRRNLQKNSITSTHFSFKV